MITALRAACLLPVPFLMLAGCAAKGEFPSLAPRPSELTGSAQPVAVQPLAASDPARIARIGASVSKAESGVAPFEAALAKARAAVNASDGARGSERWIAGQMAVSQLERTTAPVQIALAELDQEKRILLSVVPSEDVAAVNAALARVEGISSSQQASVRSLLDALSRR